MPDEKDPKVVVIISGGVSAMSEEHRAALLGQIREQQLDPDLDWSDIEVLDDPDLITSILKPQDETDPYQKYWDRLLVEEALGVPRVYH